MMKSLFRLFSSFLVVAFFMVISCTSDKKQTPTDVENTEAFGEKPVASTPIPDSGTMSGDTLNIHGKFVLFFGPVEQPDSMRSTTPAELSRFKAVFASVSDTLQSVYGIKSMYSSAGVFRIYSGSSTNVMVLSKSAMHTETGILMSDGGQPPTIKKGMFTAEEFQPMIKKYFLLP